MKVDDVSESYAFTIKTCKNHHTFLGLPSLEEKCEDCGEILE